MPRTSRVYLEDILEATRKSASHTANLSKPRFSKMRTPSSRGPESALAT